MTGIAMTRDEIFNLIVDGLTSTFQIDRARVTPEATLYEDLDIDSIDAVDLAAKLQRETGMRMSPEVFKSVRTVADLATALEKLLTNAPPIDRTAARVEPTDANRFDGPSLV